MTDEEAEDRAGDRASDRANVGALIEAQLTCNEELLRKLFAELSALATMIPGTTPPLPDTDDDDARFDDVPV